MPWVGKEAAAAAVVEAVDAVVRPPTWQSLCPREAEEEAEEEAEAVDAAQPSLYRFEGADGAEAEDADGNVR